MIGFVHGFIPSTKNSVWHTACLSIDIYWLKTNEILQVKYHLYLRKEFILAIEFFLGKRISPFLRQWQTSVPKRGSKYWNYYLNLFILYWNTIDLQCCVRFRLTAKWFSNIYIHDLTILFQTTSHLGYYRILSSLSYTICPFWLSILYMVMYIC